MVPITTRTADQQEIYALRERWFRQFCCTNELYCAWRQVLDAALAALEAGESQSHGLMAAANLLYSRYLAAVEEDERLHALVREAEGPNAVLA